MRLQLLWDSSYKVAGSRTSICLHTSTATHRLLLHHMVLVVKVSKDLVEFRFHFSDISHLIFLVILFFFICVFFPLVLFILSDTIIDNLLINNLLLLIQ